MATIQAKMSRGHKYWYIIESRRINGKPRPVVLAYLGKPEDLLKRLQGLGGNEKIKSYSHGGVCALLETARQLDIAAIINRHIKSSRSYRAQKPIRNHLTVGMTIVLAAIGRVCMPTSKNRWSNWVQTTSCGYLLRRNFSRVNSQHFWDMMDAVPFESIELIERQLLKKAFELYNLDSNTLFYDTTNFFTFIDSTNESCTIAERGKNKQKRNDLRQVGMAMVVTREDMIPLFHLSYKGNLHDTKVSAGVLGKIKKRLTDLSLDIDKHTLVFDRGVNSKDNLSIVKNLSMYYVGALTPSHHKQLIDDACKKFQDIDVNGVAMQVFRDKRVIWGEERTLVVFVSENLKAGQLRGIYQSLEKKTRELQKLQSSLKRSKTKKQDKDKLQSRIKRIIKGQFTTELIEWSLQADTDGKFQLHFPLDQQKLKEIEDKLGFRILMTNRHDWDTVDIIKAYYGQSQVEQTFKNLKNPYHLAVRPQFHWTDQKIIVHNFICVIGLLLSSIIYHQVKTKTGFNGTMGTLLDSLNDIRLAAVLTGSDSPGPMKASYQLEQTSEYQQQLMQVLKIEDNHIRRPQFNDVGVYT
jgi:transposase